MTILPLFDRVIHRDAMFGLLLQYGEDHADYNVPKSGVVTLVDGSKVNLGQWLKSQRKLRRAGKLQQGRLKLVSLLSVDNMLFICA